MKQTDKQHHTLCSCYSLYLNQSSL